VHKAVSEQVFIIFYPGNCRIIKVPRLRVCGKFGTDYVLDRAITAERGLPTNESSHEVIGLGFPGRFVGCKIDGRSVDWVDSSPPNVSIRIKNINVNAEGEEILSLYSCLLNFLE
jgi:hypothetical protein